MKPVVVHEDPERALQGVLEGLLRGRGDSTPISATLPSAWTVKAGRHIVVQWDGTPTVRPPVLFSASVRMTCWAARPTDAKALAILCQGLLLSYRGGPDIARLGLLAGILATQDPDNKAPIATFTVRVDMRGRVLAPADPQPVD